VLSDARTGVVANATATELRLCFQAPSPGQQVRIVRPMLVGSGNADGTSHVHAPKTEDSTGFNEQSMQPANEPESTAEENHEHDHQH